ncbi:uncharacterized protein LOC110113045 [Dendrobium catenatum]|uniref:uncharacterized protein LOC110113045 n=1 Tax=Dendrobium catenatum TaxID=906689 RepID=UPI0010A0C12E|nr:uncharacterized protein LOC110113045 [Dendrobium catenatum]
MGPDERILGTHVTLRDAAPLTNGVIETGNTGATIHFGGLEFSAATARAAAVPVYGVNSDEFSGRSHSARISAAQGRVSVFERLSESEALTTKRVVTGRKISMVTANTTNLHQKNWKMVDKLLRWTSSKKDCFTWTYTEMPGLSPDMAVHRLAIKPDAVPVKTPIGIFCYTVMPFGLKNAGATYQRAMTRIFDDLIHQKVECYVDDLVVKIMDRRYHLSDLRVVFERIRKYDLKMNPLKCAFLRQIIGICCSTSRFISNMSGRCQPFSKLMKKDVRFKWDEECQEAFDSIKRYLLNPPILAAPIPGKPLILYTAALEESLRALLAQHNEEEKENALYYISRRLIGAEIHYSPIKKSFGEKAVKGQVLADFLAAHPIPADSPLNDDLPNEQIMNVEEEEMLRRTRPPNLEKAQAGIGLIFVAPEEGIMRFSFSLTEPRTNNEAEYEALIAGLEIAIDVRIRNLQIFGDSQLILTQVPRGQNGKADFLAKLAKEMANMDDEWPIIIMVHNRRILEPALLQFPQSEGIPNSSQQDTTPVDPQPTQPVDLEDQLEEHQVPKKRRKVSQASESWWHCLDVEEKNDWRQPFVDYFKEGRLPTEKSLAAQIRKRAL